MYVKDDNGVNMRDGWQKTGYERDLNTQNYGGALFWSQGKFDKTNMAYAHISINRKTVSTLQLQGEDGNLTTASESSVFIH